MIWSTLSQIVGVLTNVLVVMVITQMVIGLLISFRVINPGNGFLMQIYQSIDALLAPLLRPIRKIMPSTGMLDFSPLVLIIGLTILQIIFNNIAYSVA